MPNVARPVNQDAPETEKSDDEALVKMLLPLHVLLFDRSVDDAAEMVYVPPRPTAVPLSVIALEVETTLPLASVERSDDVRPENQVLPASVVLLLDALVKLVDEAMIVALLSQRLVVVDCAATPPYVVGVNGHAPLPPVGQADRQSPAIQSVAAENAVDDA